MRTVFIQTLGCRTNQYDSASIAYQLNLEGITSVARPEMADVCIVNTCTVTARADAKSRQIIHGAIRACGKKPVIVVGCGPQNNKAMFQSIPGVTAVFGVNAAKQICNFLSLPEKTISVSFGPVSTLENRTRVHLKIQDGCDSFCTYCIVPFMRGKPVSRPFSDVIDQIRTLADSGYKEIVLTGIHIGRYADNGKTLDDVVETGAEIPGSFRIRISSIEPQEISPRLIELTVNHPKVCNHLHVSIQSGDDEILKLMGRRYAAGTVFSLLEKIRVRDPLFGLGADFIIGFNGESERHFNSTLSRVAESVLSYGHVFPFSLRKGTAVEHLPGAIASVEKSRRCREIKAAFQKHKQAFLAANMGKNHVIVYENDQTGLTSNYIRVLCAEPAEQGDMIPVVITGYGKDFARGANLRGNNGVA